MVGGGRGKSFGTVWYASAMCGSLWSYLVIWNLTERYSKPDILVHFKMLTRIFVGTSDLERPSRCCISHESRPVGFSFVVQI